MKKVEDDDKEPILSKKAFEEICDDYAEGTPLDKLIPQHGISVVKFYQFLGEDPEREAAFETAQRLYSRFQENNLVTKALISFEKLITGYTEVEYMEEFVPQYGEDGKEISRVVTKRQEKTKHFQPSAQMVQLALEKLIPHKYSQPSKLLPETPRVPVKQVFKIGNQIIDFS